MGLIASASKSNRLLASRRFTSKDLNTSQEAFTSVLDIQSSEVYTQGNLITSSGLPHSGSTQNRSYFQSSGENITQYWYRQRLTKSNVDTDVWFFLSPTGSATGVTPQLIQDGQQTNLISPKYSISSLANSNTEDSTPGYGIKVFKSTSTDSGSLGGGDVVSANDYQFDYKTGVMQFNDNKPSSNDIIYVTAYQYVGRTLEGGISTTGAVTASNMLVTGDIISTGDSAKISGSSTSTGSFGRLQIAGNSSLTGDLTIGGNIQIGDADTDSLTITADLTSHLTPNADGTYDIGSAVKNWRYGYIEQVTTTHVTASGNISASGNLSATGNLDVDGTSDFASHITSSGNISSSGIIYSEHLYTSDDAEIVDSLTIGGTISNVSTTHVTSSGNISASGNIYGTGNLDIDGTSDFASHITSSGNISSSGTIIGSTFQGIFNGALSSSAQIASNISGSFTAVSSSFSTRVTTEESNVDTLQSTMISEQTNIDNLQTDSGSFSTRITTAETELGNTLISGSAQIASNISGSLGANASLIRSLTAPSISGSFTSVSSSLASRLTSEEGEAEGSVVSSSVQIASDISGSWRGELSSSALTYVGGGVSGSLASSASFGRVEATAFAGDGQELTNVTDPTAIAMAIVFGG
jgi:hypothetical protein